ncbi:DNA polymerase III subunit chi [Psychrobacter sp. TAE2020]|uniref:DNA polymerase III subunit chi n=1 Tax=Psychrobacter sp. TAE2020 TaxID=2846762 RepID=UPI001C11EC12|nr:DNA polymerase III subunit chi [Psychrobacter sp. TAE2020]MBU5617075.1 DNA polymerase III subunit chi [Psychrobacter sp. TAE2020]
MSTYQTTVNNVTNGNKLPVSFYVLSDHKAQDFLGFISQLVQTALNKSQQSLLLLIDNESLLNELDEALWSQQAVSFIPHQLLVASSTAPATDDLLAPVLLGDYLPSQFKGIVLNTTTRAVNDFMSTTSNTLPTRILEIIKPDTTSMQQGREKYKRYQQLGYELTHFKV